ncbi:MAG: LptF/LptG family permease [Verrucomicrobia bacterium]|nr:LptF/LptG family permease [Verrucomicrobiota bacterium]MDA1007255.1 LptF/LptG family permease [Verrucomicrobiota bacterium]
MRIADRYIGWQIFFGTIFGVSLLTVVLVMSQIMKEIRPYLVEHGAPLSLVGKFILYILPFSLIFTLPWGFLASVLLGFGRLSSHNELISLRMAGVSLGRIAAPVIVLGILFSSLTYWISGTVAPRATAAQKSLLYEALSRDPSVFLNPGVVQAKFPGQKVYIEDREGDSLHGFHLYQLSSNDRDAKATSYVHAGEVDLKVDMEQKLFILTLTAAHIETTKKDGTMELATAAEAEPWFIDWSNTKTKKARVEELTNTELTAHMDDVDLPPQLRKDFQVELHKRRSLSLACLAFAFIGIPLGISGQRKETSAGFLMSLLVAAVYFSGMLFVDPFEKSSLTLIASLVWLPNVACLLLGVWLFRRASHR